ncbi:MAG: hypothetical protein ACUVXA_00220 [Candidatus Jordarchaeum sp.]|uniref:hypothetical protein n=1 Tax=Candidatus Jordarchaeum sp. TaxID=2823881 RepID=UPI0040491A32
MPTEKIKAKELEIETETGESEERKEFIKSYAEWADRNAKLFSLINVCKFMVVATVGLLSYFISKTYLQYPYWIIATIICTYISMCAVSPRFAAPFLKLLSHGKWPSKDKFSLVDPLHDVSFFFMEGEDSVLIMRDNYKLAAYAMMKLEEIPLSIRGSFNYFFRTLYLQKIPVIYFVEGSPVSERTVRFLPNLEEGSRRTIARRDTSRRKTWLWGEGGVWTTRIVLGTKKETIAPVRLDHSIGKLVEEVKMNAFTLATAFENSYPHCKIEPLVGESLLDATRAMLTGGAVSHFF